MKEEISMANKPEAAKDGVNRAKLYQLALFPLNNGATNVYFVLILSYVAQFGSSILELGLYASVMVTVMRVFDAITDPIIGALMVLTPGVALTMGIRDIINSDYLSGTIRLVDALLVAGCLAVGVTLGYTLLSTVTGVVW